MDAERKAADRGSVCPLRGSDRAGDHHRRVTVRGCHDDGAHPVLQTVTLQNSGRRKAAPTHLIK